MRSATAAADPLDDPPGVCAVPVRIARLPGENNANSAVTVLPMITAPALLSIATHAASCEGRWPA